MTENEKPGKPSHPRSSCIPFLYVPLVLALMSSRARAGGWDHSGGDGRFGSAEAACKDMIGAGGFYVFSHTEPIDATMSRCFSKPKEGKGDPVYVGVLSKTEMTQPNPEETAPEKPAVTEETAPAEKEEDLPLERPKGKRFKRGEEQNQAEGVEDFEKDAQKERKKIRGEEGSDWEGQKMPKQQRINSKKKSDQRIKGGGTY